MKTRIFLLLFFIALMWQTAYSQFDIVWYKNVPNYIQTVTFSHDAKWIMAWPASTNIMIFDIHTGNLVNDKIPATVEYPFFSLDDTHLFGRTGNRIVYYNLATGLEESKFEPATKNLGATDVAKDESYIVSTTEDGFHIWDVKTGKLIKTKLIPRDTTSQSDPF